MPIRSLFLSGLLISGYLVSLNVQGGACDPESESREHHQRRVDGPANARLAPGGKIIGSIPNRAVVTLIGFQEIDESSGAVVWYHLKWKQGGKTRDGWTHEQNIVCD